MSLKLYDAVRVNKINVPLPYAKDWLNVRNPEIGDIAYIIEIYCNPPGYELECSDESGITQWLMSFAPEEVELELA